MRLTAEDLAVRDWGDAYLHELRWENAGRDMVLVLLTSGGSVELRCSWASDVRLSIDTSGRGGMVLTWEGGVRVLSDGRYELSLDFAHSGHLAVVCNEVQGVLFQD